MFKFHEDKNLPRLQYKNLEHGDMICCYLNVELFDCIPCMQECEYWVSHDTDGWMKDTPQWTLASKARTPEVIRLLAGKSCLVPKQCLWQRDMSIGQKM